MTSPNPWQDADSDGCARFIAEQAKRESEGAIGHRGQPSRPSQPESPPKNPLPNTLESLPRRSPTDPDALARLIAQQARRESEALIGKSNGLSDRLWLYLILTPGVGMALSPWMLVRSRSTPRQRQASRLALAAGSVWLVLTLLSLNGGDVGASAPVRMSLNSVATGIYVSLMLNQMFRVWRRKSLSIKW